MARRKGRGPQRPPKPKAELQKSALEPSIVDAIRPEVQRQVEAQLIQVVESFSGPLPPPQMLREYDQVIPGCAERVIKMAEEQTKHRQELERNVVEGGTRRSWWGLWIGGFIFLVLLVIGAILVATGHDVAGVAFIGIDVTGILTAFITGRADQRRERIEKAQIGGFR